MKLLLLFLFLIGCQNIQTPTTQIVPVPKETKALWSNSEWTTITLDALETHGKAMLELNELKDAQTYCPKYSKLTKDQRKAFYVYLISAMALRESGFKPSTNYTEGFKDSKGNSVISRGLLQISQESANQSAYKCDIQKAPDLNDVKTNLVCGIRILNYWVPKDKNLGTSEDCIKNGKKSTCHYGAARYWSVMRDTSKSKAKIIEKMKALEVCK